MHLPIVSAIVARFWTKSNVTLAQDLIHAPRKIHSGFDYSKTDLLKPTGAADRANILKEKSRNRRDTRFNP